MRRIVHEIRNHLAVVTANVEAIRDGMVDASPERLSRLLDALAAVDALLRELPRGTPHAIGAQCACVTFAGDPARVAETVGGAVSAAVRHGADGTRLTVSCARAGMTLRVTIIAEADAKTDALEAAGHEVARFARARGVAVEIEPRALVLVFAGVPLAVRPHAGPGGIVSLL